MRTSAKLSFAALSGLALILTVGPAGADQPQAKSTAFAHCVKTIGESLAPRAIHIRRVSERGVETFKFYLDVTAAGHDEPMECECTASAKAGVLRAKAFELRPVMEVAQADA